MSEETEMVEVEGAQTAAEDQDQQQPEQSAEDRALAMGWTPKGQFRGDPEKWVDADTFIKRGEEFLPFLKANNKRLEQALERSNTKLASVEKTLERFAEHHTKTEARAYERALREIEGRIDAAAAAGDVAGVREGTAELVGLTKDATPADASAEPPELVEWKAANPWFGKDKALTAATAAIGDEAVAEGFSGKALIKEVDRRLREQFPSKFENPNRRQPGAVEGSGSAPRKAGKTYSDLPADAKAACDDFVTRKLLTREQYVKDYFQ